METPDVYVLSRVEWQFWCTLTFKRQLPNYVHGSMFLAWMRGLERLTRVQRKRLLWVCRRELGELGSRLHLHVLVGGVPDWVVTAEYCFHLMRMWERLGGGFARVYVYEPGLSAVAYTLDSIELDGAQLYECRKFGTASAVTLSEEVVRLLTQQTRSHWTPTEKRDTLAQV